MKTFREEIIEIIAKSFKEKFDSMLDDGSVYFKGSEEYADQIIQSLLNRLPKEKKITGHESIGQDGFKKGYNACLKELTKIIKG